MKYYHTIHELKGFKSRWTWPWHSRDNKLEAVGMRVSTIPLNTMDITHTDREVLMWTEKLGQIQTDIIL